MLHELNKESLLLLYAADELSAWDHADVGRMLKADASLRAELERLQGTIHAFEAGMARLDARPVAGDAHAVQRTGQAMRQRLADQLMRAVPGAKAGAQPSLRYPWWVYPSVGAAVVLICFVSWWGHRPDSMINIPADPHTLVRGGGPMGHALSEVDEAQLAEGIQNNFADSNPTQPEKSVASLNAAEDQIAELSRVQTDFRVNDGNE